MFNQVPNVALIMLSNHFSNTFHLQFALLNQSWKHFFAQLHSTLLLFCGYGCSQRKSTLKWISSAYVNYEYRHLGSWYIKSTPYKRFLNWNKVFKNKVVTDKTTSFVRGSFCTPHCVCLNKKFLLDGRYDEPVFIYSRFVGMTI